MYLRQNSSQTSPVRCRSSYKTTQHVQESMVQNVLKPGLRIDPSNPLPQNIKVCDGDLHGCLLLPNNALRTSFTIFCSDLCPSKNTRFTRCSFAKLFSNSFRCADLRRRRGLGGSRYQSYQNHTLNCRLQQVYA